MADPDPSGTADDAARCELADYAASVARDIEALLNTRNTRVGVPSPGILGFGLRDFSSFSCASSADRESMARAVQHAIETQDTRIQDVTVTVRKHQGDVGALGFVIAGKLRAEPYLHTVDFRATFFPTRLRFTVEAT